MARFVPNHLTEVDTGIRRIGLYLRHYTVFFINLAILTTTVGFSSSSRKILLLRNTLLRLRHPRPNLHPQRTSVGEVGAKWHL